MHPEDCKESETFRLSDSEVQVAGDQRGNLGDQKHHACGNPHGHELCRIYTPAGISAGEDIFDGLLFVILTNRERRKDTGNQQKRTVLERTDHGVDPGTFELRGILRTAVHKRFRCYGGEKKQCNHNQRADVKALLLFQFVHFKFHQRPHVICPTFR